MTCCCTSLEARCPWQSEHCGRRRGTMRAASYPTLGLMPEAGSERLAAVQSSALGTIAFAALLARRAPLVHMHVKSLDVTWAAEQGF